MVDVHDIKKHIIHKAIPAINCYELGLLIYKRELEENPRKRPSLISRKVDKIVCQLIDEGVLLSAREFKEKAFLTQLYDDDKKLEAVCAVDTFAYVSHLSALEHYGLSHKRQKKVYITNPTLSSWNMLSRERIEEDYGDDISLYYELEMPRLVKIKFSRIGGSQIVNYFTSQYGSFNCIHDNRLRVATVGRVFLDSVREPNLCGGMYEVIDVFKNHARKYLDEIIDQIDLSGKKIEKVRAGYILDEICKIKHDKIEEWARFAQRGGSRKLDPNAPYYPDYSEKWCLSLNI